MAVRFWSAVAGASALLSLALPSAPPARAGNYDYNFNAQPHDWTVFNTGSFTTPVSGTMPPAPWEWTGGPSKNEGGWHTRIGPDGAGPGTFLQSPCFFADGVGQDYVQLDMDHRFNFVSATGTSILALGQAQYRINSGTWFGVPLQAFLDANTGTSGNILPTYAVPQPAPPFDAGQPAWEGTTLDFTDTKKHQKSAFRFYVSGSNATLSIGDEIEFRFLMGPQLPSDPPYDINWEINSVNIKGVTACPEPGTLALAGLGGLGVLLTARRRRWRPAPAVRAVCGSTAATVVVVIAIACLLAATPARAQSTFWDFQTGDGNWATSGEKTNSQPPDSNYFWTWNSLTPPSGGTTPHWHVRSEPLSPPVTSAYYLTSPSISGLSGTATAKSARISIAHDFLFQTGTSGLPRWAGQVQYQINGSNTWLSLPLSAFSSGSVSTFNPVFGDSPFWSGTLQYVNSATFVSPNYVTPTGSGTFKLVPAGSAMFTGTSPGWPSAYVPTQALLSVSTGEIPAGGISSLQLRFLNLNRGLDCDAFAGWDVRFVQVDFSSSLTPVPEPAALAIGGTGFVALGAAAALRRLVHQRHSRPSESPCTTTLPPVLVAPLMELS